MRAMRTSPVLYAALASAVSLSCADQRAHYELKLPDLHLTLPDNGLRVIVLPDDTTPLVAIAMRYEVGSNEDPVGKEGLAHLVEHLMFQKRGESSQPPVMAAFRALTVYVNAYTNWDSTNYDSLATKENLEPLLRLEAMRLYNQCENIDEATFERERDVVRNEIRQRSGRPVDQVEYLIGKDVFPDDHPYQHLVGGNDESIANIKLEDACQFMKDYYTPSRAILVVAGNTNAAEMHKLVGDVFSGLPAREPKPRKPVPAITLKKKRVDHELDIEEPIVNVAWMLPPAFSEDDAAAQFMIGGVVGGVNREGEQWDFATSVNATVVGGKLGAAFVVQVHLRSAGDVDKALDAIWRAARESHRGWSANSQIVDDLRAQLISQKVYEFEDLTGRTGDFADYAQFDKSGEFFGGELHRLRSVSLSRIKSYIGSALSPDKAVVVVVKPKAGAQHGDRRASTSYQGAQDVQEELQVDPEEARQRIPAPKGSSIAGAKRFTLGNGMRVVLLPSGSALPVMSIRLVFDAGSAQESPDSAGLAEVAARYLNPPPAFGPGSDIGDTISNVGGEFGVQVEPDHTIFMVRGLNIYSDKLILGLERRLKIGEYNQESIERYRKYMGFRFKLSEERQRHAAHDALYAALYGADHPYAQTGLPTQKSLGHLGRDAAMAFRSHHFTAKNGTIIVAGKFDPKSVERSIRSTFGDWSGGSQDKPVAIANPKRDGQMIVGVIGDELPQIRAVIAYPAPAGVDGQYAARLVLAEMLNLRVAAVREQLGTSYGVYGQLQTGVGGGAYLAGGSIDAARAGESLAAMRAGVESLRTGDRFDEDFVRARRTVLKEQLRVSSSSQDLASKLEFLAKYHLDEKFNEKLLKQIAALSPEQVKQLIADELAPAHEIVFCQGSKAELEKAFADAKLTPTEWVDATVEKK